ncbi:hypothetical protein ACKKBG_A11855 [Auxenochlorella protothecoides x Auxenochlorella symbiontica]
MVEIASSSQDSLLAKVVLVTGCSSGLGQALATCLHSQTTPDGRTLYKVYATARRLKTLEPLADLGISTLALDVGSEASVKEAVATVLSQEERLDVLVNNAGISKFGPLAEQPLSEVTAVFDTNVMGVLRMTQAVVPSMAARGGGLVVNIGSVSAWLATPYAGAYCASKAALHALSDSLRLELRPFNIQVTTVTAGAITSSFSNNAEAGQSGERYERPGSLYRAHAPSIRARARMSQNSKGVQPASQVAARIAGVINAATAPGAKPPPAWFLAAGGALKLWVLGLLQKVLGRALDSTIAGQFGLA